MNNMKDKSEASILEQKRRRYVQARAWVEAYPFFLRAALRTPLTASQANSLIEERAAKLAPGSEGFDRVDGLLHTAEVLADWIRDRRDAKR